MNDDVQSLLAEIGFDSRGETVDGKIAGLLISLARPEILWRVGESIECRVKGINVLELKKLAIRKAARLVHLAALEKVVEDGERGRPRSHGNRRTSFGQSLGDRKAETAIIRNAGNKRPAAGKINIEHRI
jgi:hypothetical protein